MKLQKPKKCSSLITGLLCLAANFNSLFASPFEISYSGRLVDERARPLTGSLYLSIRFFDAATAGNQKGGVLNFPNVQPNSAGIFTLSLVIPSTEFTAVLGDDQETWIEVTDLSSNKIYPRHKLTASPYALRVPYDKQSLRYDSQGRLAVNQIEQSQVAGLASKLGQLANSVHTHSLGGDLNGDLGTATVVKLRGNELSNAAPTAGQYLKWNGTAWTPASLSGELSLGSQASLGLGSYSDGEELNLKSRLTAADKGKMWFNADTKQIKYWDSAAVQVVGAVGTGLNNLNGLTSNTQGFSLGTSGTAPGWISSAGIHSLNIPQASSPGVTAGLISRSDYDNFSGKINSSGGSFTGDVYLSGQKELRLSELSPMTGNNYVALRAPQSIDSDLVLTLPASAGVSGQVLSTNGAGILSWIPAATGSLTSLTAVAPLDVTSGSTPALSLRQAGSSADGYLSSADWNLFNSKQNVLSFATGTSGNAPNFSVNGDIRTLNIPQASTPGVTAGLLSKTEYDSFSDKVEKTGAFFSGTVTMSNQNQLRFSEPSPNGSESVGLRAPTAISTNVTWTLPAADGSPDQVLKTDGAGNLGWASAATGSVTSVGLTAPAQGLTVGGGPITSAGTLSLSLSDDLAAVEAINSTGGVERTAANTWSTYNLTPAGKALLDDVDALTQRGTLGLGALAIKSTIDLASNDTSGTLSVTKGGTGIATASANQFFATPTGGSGAPSFRAIASSDLPEMLGDSGAGGSKGAVPAPGAGDGSAGKFLRADGSWSVPATNVNWASPGAIGSTTASSGVFTTLTATGNVGIGTSNPQYGLDVAGQARANILLANNGTAPGGMWHLGMLTAGISRVGLGLGGTESGSNAGSDFQIWTYTDSGAFLGNPMTIKRSSGNVGIGTTEPARTLDVNGSGRFSTSLAVEATTTWPMLELTGYNSAAYPPHIIFQSSRGSASAPSSTLSGDALGVIQSRGFNSSTGFEHSGSPIVFYAAENFSGTAMGQYMTFQSTPIGTKAPMERVRIAADGNVGIGTTTPTTALEVDGTIKGNIPAGGSYSETLQSTTARNQWIDSSVNVTVPHTGSYLIQMNARMWGIGANDYWWKARVLNQTTNTSICVAIGLGYSGTMSKGDGTVGMNKIANLTAGDVLRLQFYITGSDLNIVHFTGDQNGGSGISIIRVSN